MAFKVSKKTEPRFIAEEIIKSIKTKKRRKRVVLEAVGAQAVHNTIKGTILSREELEPRFNVSITPEFFERENNGTKLKGLRFLIEITNPGNITLKL